MDIRSRQDAIVRHLRRNGAALIADLAAEVGASRRTILRDIGALREQGFVIHTESGPGGGVQLDVSSIITAARLTISEVFALVICVATLRAAQQMPFVGLADAGLAKLEKSLSADKVRDLRRFMDCLYVGQISPLQDLSDLRPTDPALLPAFETAFLNQTCLRFAYRDARGQISEREVEPQAMLVLPPLWYLVGWDPTRADFRHFRMDRISAPEPNQEKKFLRKRVPFEKDVCPFWQTDNTLSYIQK
jgi:predicted DNA-binding transcriptional regulator YafY